MDHEFNLLNEGYPLTRDVCGVTDSLVLARKKHPGQKNNLDVLCRRYGIDNSNRELHGALLDAEILAMVYLAMTGGQTALSLDEGTPVRRVALKLNASRLIVTSAGAGGLRRKHNGTVNFWTGWRKTHK